MKTAVIYTSQTGFTKRYAEWIAEAVGADCFTLAQAGKMDFSAFDAIIYGGWTCAGGIRGIGWFRKNLGRWGGKKLAVFCTGGSPLENPEVFPALRKNFAGWEWEKLRVFYCPGGFNYEKMPAASRLMMKVFLKTLRARRDKTQEQEMMVKMIGSSYDVSDWKYIEPIVQYLQKKSSGETG